MKGILVDFKVILGAFLNGLKWADWSEAKLEEYSDNRSSHISFKA